MFSPRWLLTATYLTELIPSGRIKGRVILTFLVIQAVEEPTPILRTLAAAIRVHGSVLLTRLSSLTNFHPLPLPPLCLAPRAQLAGGRHWLSFLEWGWAGCPQPVPTSLGTFETGRDVPSRQVSLRTVVFLSFHLRRRMPSSSRCL